MYIANLGKNSKVKPFRKCSVESMVLIGLRRVVSNGNSQLHAVDSKCFMASKWRQNHSGKVANPKTITFQLTFQ